MNIYAKTIRTLEILSDSNQYFTTIRTVSSSCRCATIYTKYLFVVI